MLIRVGTLERIRAGEVDRQYRRWDRPTVKPGGTLTTAVGVLDVLAVEEVDPAAITDLDAQLAGEDSAVDLRALLDGKGARSVRGRPAAVRTGPVYCVRLAYRGEDPRRAAREDASDGAVQTAVTALERLDAASRRGPWTHAVLAAILGSPGRRAPDLAERFGWDTPWFKAQVRKLKGLGLTESLDVGYRISPRGQAVCARLGLGDL